MRQTVWIQLPPRKFSEPLLNWRKGDGEVLKMTM
jgi:hypothetical protein